MSDSVVPRRRRTTISTRAALVIAWCPYAGRSAELARGLGAPCHFVHVLAFRRPLLAPLKYPLRGLLTWSLQWRQRPRAVVVQNPPLPAVLCVALYTWLDRAPFIIDSHSAALVDRKWAWSRPAQHWLGRRATATLVHAATLLPRVAGAGRVLVVEDPPPTPLPVTRSVPRPPTPRVVVIGSFGADEPLEAILAAAAAMPDVLALPGPATRGA